MTRFKTFTACAVAALMMASPAAAASIASVTLNGGSFLQSGSVLNNGSSTANITSVVYSLGAPADGIATWDGSTGGGVASDNLANPNFFQTVTFAGLSVAPGDVFNISGLDIDLIVTLAPLDVTGIILDNFGSSLANAFVTVGWSDGSQGTGDLAETPWSTSQSFRILSAPVNVPEPGMIGLLGLGLAAWTTARRRKI